MQQKSTQLLYLLIAILGLTSCMGPMKAYIKHNIEQPAGNSAFSTSAYATMNTEKNRKSLRGATPATTYFVEGRIIEQLKSGTQEDSGRIYTFYRTVERLADEGYKFAEDDAIKKMWKKAGKDEMVFTAKKYCKFMREKWKKEGTNIRQRDSILTANIYLLGAKRRTLGLKLREARTKLLELKKEKQQERTIKLNLEVMKKNGKTAIQAGNEIKGLMAATTATFTPLPNNEMGFEWTSNKTTSDTITVVAVKGAPDEFLLGNICHNSITDYAKEIANQVFKNIAERTKTNKQKPTVYLDVNGRADGHAYHKKLKNTYLGEYGNPFALSYYLEDTHNISSFQNGNAGFSPASINLAKGQTFYNKDLALLRAACFEKALYANAQLYSSSFNLGQSTLFATEFSEKGKELRGVRFSVRIVGLYEHNTEEIKKIETKMKGLAQEIQTVSEAIKNDLTERQDLAAKMRDLNERRSEVQVQRNIDETWQLADAKSLANVIGKDSTFHLILFADTNDPNITASANAVVVNMQLLMRSAADSIHYNFREYNYADSGFTIDQLKALLKKEKFRTRDNDIVIFYFLGHGTNSSTNDFPHLLLADKAGESSYMNADGSLTAQAKQKGNGIDLQEVYENLAKNKLKTLICMGETCNGVTKTPTTVIKILEMRTNDTLHTATAKALFSDYNGKWLISSASKGQKSWAFENGGTIFFNILYNTMLEKPTISSTSDAWEVLLRKVEYNVSNETVRIGTGYLQTPTFIKK